LGFVQVGQMEFYFPTCTKPCSVVRNLSTKLQMERSQYILSLFLIVSIIISCTNSKNFKQAYGLTQNGQAYIKLKGVRQSMAHDPGSLDKTYEDSILIQVPSFENGVINGENIPVEKGQYKYSGTIMINGNDLKVDLLINDTDVKKLRQLTWNGTYKLTIK
jgi:hypothetical protein